jgi:hypothetical protein
MVSTVPSEFPEITHHLISVVDAYDEYLVSHSKEDAGLLAVSCHRTYMEIMTIRETLSAISKSLKPQDEFRESEERLTLIYFDEISYDTLLARLAALKAIYQQLCDLAGISVEERPLRIVKVETGTLEITVTGDQTVTLAIASLLYLFGREAHRRFTMTGQVEQVGSLVNVRDELKGRGIPTGGADKNIGDAFEKITANFSAMVRGVPTFTVNGESIVDSTPSARLSFDGKGHLQADDEVGAPGPRMLGRVTDADKGQDQPENSPEEQE